jgi:pyruvate formate lyase activating enzyme
MTGTILNIQHYAVNDGPGIRTLVFFKGCPLRCSWCCNPESQATQPQLRYISFRCKLCLDCVSSCPTSSVSFADGAFHRNFNGCHSCVSKDCIEKCNYDALSISGKEISSDKLVGIIARDIAFYRNSGGGVTFSGGEPLMQPAFLLDVLRKCKIQNIHTAVETCGWADRKTFQSILPYTDLFLFDLKIIDPEQHVFYTGQPVEPVLGNLAFLAAEKADVTIRFPLIPGITDTLKNLESIADIMTRNNLRKISLEPYHTLGREKYDEHMMPYRLDHLGQYNPGDINSISGFFRERGFVCEIA